MYKIVVAFIIEDLNMCTDFWAPVLIFFANMETNLRNVVIENSSCGHSLHAFTSDKPYLRLNKKSMLSLFDLIFIALTGH